MLFQRTDSKTIAKVSVPQGKVVVSQTMVVLLAVVTSEVSTGDMGEALEVMAEADTEATQIHTATETTTEVCFICLCLIYVKIKIIHVANIREIVLNFWFSFHFIWKKKDEVKQILTCFQCISNHQIVIQSWNNKSMQWPCCCELEFQMEPILLPTVLIS